MNCFKILKLDKFAQEIQRFVNRFRFWIRLKYVKTLGRIAGLSFLNITKFQISNILLKKLEFPRIYSISGLTWTIVNFQVSIILLRKQSFLPTNSVFEITWKVSQFNSSDKNFRVSIARVVCSKKLSSRNPFSFIK